MTRIICRASECVYWEDGLCGSEEIEYDPDAGCLTFEDVSDAAPEEGEETLDWGDEGEEDLFEEEEEEQEDEEELWDDEEEESPWRDDWEDNGL